MIAYAEDALRWAHARLEMDHDLDVDLARLAQWRGEQEPGWSRCSGSTATPTTPENVRECPPGGAARTRQDRPHGIRGTASGDRLVGRRGARLAGTGHHG